MAALGILKSTFSISYPINIRDTVSVLVS